MVKKILHELIREISKIEGIKWIRVFIVMQKKYG